MIKKIGFDFICKGHQHHTYFIGAFKYNICDEIILDYSCNLSSPFIGLLKSHQRFRYFNLFIKISLILLYTFNPNTKIIILGINNYFIPFLTPFSLIKKIEIHLHGQIYKTTDKYNFFWKILSNIFSLVVANPIYLGPKYIKKTINFASYDFLKKKKLNQMCLVYGSNHEYLKDLELQSFLIKKNYTLIKLIPKQGYVEWSEIIKYANRACYTFLKLDPKYYYSPSGRIGDLRILNLKPLIKKNDKISRDILNKYKLKYTII